MNLLLRADATTEIGTGHAMRCLALAQAWQDGGGSVIFAAAGMIPAIEEKLRSESIQVERLTVAPGTREDLEATAVLAGRHSAEWIVADGYQFSPAYQQGLRGDGRKLLFIDDAGEGSHYFADVVLNQNIHARGESYAKREPHTRLLLGPKFAMLRREFRTRRTKDRAIVPMGRKILVTMGGSDPANFTKVALAALEKLKIRDLEVKVVVGSGNLHSHALREQTRSIALNVYLLHGVENMAELMAWADVAVAAAGSTVWELCLLGLPALLVDIAANQAAIGVGLARQGAAIHLGSSQELGTDQLSTAVDALLRSEEQRSALSARARGLVDGQGANRVVSAMKRRIRLRAATQEDCCLLWEWANDAEVRAASFSSNSIAWEEHTKWFRKMMSETESFIFIATNEDGLPIGQVRIEKASVDGAEIGVSVAAAHRGEGRAGAMIEEATRFIFERTNLTRIDAFIKPGNRPSQRAFEGAGFRRMEITHRKGIEALHYVRERSWL